MYRALGERGILQRVKAVVVGRPKAWNFEHQNTAEQKEAYRKKQQSTIQEAVRKYNSSAPIIQNVDFGHTDPQIPIPYGRTLRIDSKEKKMFASF